MSGNGEKFRTHICHKGRARRSPFRNAPLGSEKPELTKNDYFPFEAISNIYKNGKKSELYM